MKRRLVVVLALIIALAVAAIAAQNLKSIAAPVAAREQQIAQSAESMRAKLIEQRRDFHMHPELSNREERTSRIVAERLRALGLEDIKTGVGRYGVTALLRGARPGPVVAVRTDMDALPI